jgi:hypothetical protein
VVGAESRSLEAFEGPSEDGYRTRSRHELDAVLEIPGFEDVRLSVGSLLE